MINWWQKLQDLLKKLISGSLTGMACCFSKQKILRSIGMGPIREISYLPEYIFISAMFMKTVFQGSNYFIYQVLYMLLPKLILRLLHRQQNDFQGQVK